MRLPRLNALKLSSFALPGFGSRSPAKETKAATGKPSYHAVSIASGFPSCAAVHELEGRRFLAKEAPTIPLRNCDQSECECGYKHHKDRRAAMRRDDDFGIPGMGLRPTEERRGRKDRRAAASRDSRDSVTDYFGHASGTRTLMQINEAGKVTK